MSSYHFLLDHLCWSASSVITLMQTQWQWPVRLLILHLSSSASSLNEKIFANHFWKEGGRLASVHTHRHPSHHQNSPLGSTHLLLFTSSWILPQLWVRSLSGFFPVFIKNTWKHVSSVYVGPQAQTPPLQQLQDDLLIRKCCSWYREAAMRMTDCDSCAIVTDSAALHSEPSDCQWSLSVGEFKERGISRDMCLPVILLALFGAFLQSRIYPSPISPNGSSWALPASNWVDWEQSKSQSEVHKAPFSKSRTQIWIKSQRVMAVSF